MHIRPGYGSWFGFALSLCVSTSLVGCAPDALEPATVQASNALTASPQRFLVSFASGSIPSDAASIVSAAKGTIVARYPNVGVVLASTSDTGFASVLRRDARIDAVGSARAVSSAIERPQAQAGSHHPPKTTRAPGADPLSYRQWDMDQIHAPQARAINAGKSSVLVGVIDSGIDITHPDLVGQVNVGASASCLGGVVNTDPAVWANDIIGHGTHVAGNIAGARNGVGIVGIAPGVKLAAVKVGIDNVPITDPTFGSVYADAVVCAIDWSIAHNFDLMNSSLSIDPFTAPFDDEFCTDEPDRVAIVTMVRKAVLAAGRKNITLVASTANNFLDLAHLPGATPGSTCKFIPVQLPRVIGVSAVGYTKSLSWYSDYGAGVVDLTAPGGDMLIPDPLVPDTTASGQVLSSVPPNSLYYQWAAGYDGQVQDCSSGPCSTYAYIQGTSQAAPHVTGVAALAISRFGRMPPEVLLALLSLTAKPIACPVGPYDPLPTGMPATCKGPALYNNFYGAGEVDALAIVR